MSNDHTSAQPGDDGSPPPWTCRPNTSRGRMDRAGHIAVLLLTAMFSLEGWGWGCKWEGGKFTDRSGKPLAVLLILDIIWLFIERLFC